MTRYLEAFLRAVLTALAVVGATPPTYANLLSIPFDFSPADEAMLLKCWESQENQPPECYELLNAYAAQALHDGNTNIAIKAYENARAVLQGQISGTPSDTFLLYGIAGTLEGQSKALRIEKRKKEAMIALSSGLQIIAELRERRPRFLIFTETHAVILNNMGALQNEMGQLEDALASYKLSIDIMAGMAQVADSEQDRARRLFGVMVNYHKSGAILAKLDRLEDALCFYSLANSYVDKALKEVPANPKYIRAKTINQTAINRLNHQLGEDSASNCEPLERRPGQPSRNNGKQKRIPPAEEGTGNSIVG